MYHVNETNETNETNEMGELNEHRIVVVSAVV